MARPLRIEYENALYHVTARGDRRKNIFLDSKDRDIFLNYLLRSKNRFHIIIHAFVLMNNHYHLLLETPEANLSMAMKYLNGCYTQAFNKRHGLVGHVLQGRYKAIVVDKEEYFLALIRYIHLNPIRAKSVKNLSEHRYSSHLALVNRQISEEWAKWYNADAILGWFGKRRTKAVRNYLDFISAGVGVRRDQIFGNLKYGYMLGSEGFTDWVIHNYVDRDEIDHRVSGSTKIAKRFNSENVLNYVCAMYDTSKNKLTHITHGLKSRNEARMLAIYLLTRYSAMTQKEVGKLFGGISYAAISQTAKRCEERINKPSSLQRNYRELMRILRIS